MIASQVYMLIEHFVLDNKRHPSAILVPSEMESDLLKEASNGYITPFAEKNGKYTMYNFPVYFCTNITEIKLL